MRKCNAYIKDFFEKICKKSFVIKKYLLHLHLKIKQEKMKRFSSHTNAILRRQYYDEWEYCSSGSKKNILR
jgi:hypothetical protein